MNTRLTLWFFLFATIFLVAHIVAMHLSLYWYFWWTDIVMHFWGGVLIGVGVHVLASLDSTPLRASLAWVLIALAIATISWELFERSFGLFNPDGYVLDTSMDIVLGFAGGLLAHFFLARR